MKKSTPIFLTIIAILFVTVLYLLYLNFNKTPTTINTTSTPTIGVIPTETEVATPTEVINNTPVGWITYENTEYGFSFKFPENQFTKSNPTKIECYQPNDGPELKRCELSVIDSCSSFECRSLIGVYIYLSPNNLTYINSLKSFNELSNSSKIINTNIGGIPAKMKTYSDSTIFGQIYQVNNAKYYFIIYGNPNSSVFKEVISTFKFIPSTSSDLITLIKSTAATEAKTTISKVVIGETKIIGNYAQVAFNYITGGGAIYWAAKVNGSWKIVTGGQEPPACSTLLSYGFPADFECNK